MGYYIRASELPVAHANEVMGLIGYDAAGARRLCGLARLTVPSYNGISFARSVGKSS